MEYYITQPADYWIAPNAVNISLNALGDANRIQGSVASGAVIMCFVENIKAESDGGEEGNGDGLWYGANHEPKRWSLSLSPTYFNSDTHKYVYVAIPRSTAIGTQAVVVFPSEQLDIYGRVLRNDSSDDSSDDSSGEDQYEQVGSTDYFYVYLNGIIGAAGAVTAGKREWEDPITGRDWGLLQTAQGNDEKQNSSDWYSWSQTSQTVTFLKKIAMSVTSWFQNFIIGTGATQGNLTGVAKVGATTEQNGWNSHIVTPSYLDEFGNTRYLRKDIADEAHGKIGFLGGVGFKKNGSTYDYGIDANGNADLMQLLTNLVQSKNFMPMDGMAGMGYRLKFANSRGELQVDDLYVLGKMLVNTLEIREVSYIGGVFLMTPAGSTVAAVKPLYATSGSEARTLSWHMNNAGSDVLVGYRLLWKSDDGTTDTMNYWQVGDMAFCEVFDVKEAGVYQDFSNRRWWRLVTGVGTLKSSDYPPTSDNNGGILGDGRSYHYADVSATGTVFLSKNGSSYEQEDGNYKAFIGYESANGSVPQVGDKAVCLGSMLQTTRQGAIQLKATGERDAADYPSATVDIFDGINNYLSLSNYEIHHFGKDAVRMSSRRFMWTTANGEHKPPTAFRGDWVGVKTQPYPSTNPVSQWGDEWQFEGARWICTLETGTTLEYPGASANWLSLSAPRGNFKSRVFCRSNTRPDTPSSTVGSNYNTYDSPIPPYVSGQPVWNDGVPQGTAQIWSSVATFEDTDNFVPVWSTPAPESDTQTLDIEFSLSASQPTAPTGSTPHTDHSSEGWYDPSLNQTLPSGKTWSDMIWRAERKISNGEYDGGWVITRILGETGVSVSSVIPYYKASSSKTQLVSSDSWQTSPAATSWNDTTYKYLWRKEVTTFNNRTQQETSAYFYLEFVKSGTNGTDGWVITAVSGTLIIDQYLDSNGGVAFKTLPANVSFKAVHGSRVATISSVANDSLAPQAADGLTWQFPGTVAKLTSISKVYNPVTDENEYVRTATKAVLVTATDGDETVTISVTIPVYINLLGDFQTKIEGDVETSIAYKLTYGYDNKTGKVGSIEAIGKYVRSSEENIAEISKDTSVIANTNLWWDGITQSQVNTYWEPGLWAGWQSMDSYPWYDAQDPEHSVKGHEDSSTDNPAFYKYIRYKYLIDLGDLEDLSDGPISRDNMFTLECATNNVIYNGATYNFNFVYLLFDENHNYIYQGDAIRVGDSTRHIITLVSGARYLAVCLQEASYPAKEIPYTPTSTGNATRYNIINTLKPKLVVHNYQGSIIKQLADLIRMQVGESGIDIEERKITATADQFEWRDLAGNLLLGMDSNTAVFSGTVRAKNFYHNICVFVEMGTYSNGLTNTGDADMVYAVPYSYTSPWDYNGQSTIANRTIKLPSAKEYEGKTVELVILAPGATGNMKNIYIEALGYTTGTNGKFLYDIYYSSGNIRTSQSTVSQVNFPPTIGNVKFYAVKFKQGSGVGNDNWGWLYLPSPSGGSVSPGGGGGTVTSVGLLAPEGFTVTGSPVTANGTIELDFGGSISAHKVLAAPSSSAGSPRWRSLVSSDIPSLPYLADDVEYISGIKINGFTYYATDPDDTVDLGTISAVWNGGTVTNDITLNNVNLLVTQRGNNSIGSNANPFYHLYINHLHGGTSNNMWFLNDTSSLGFKFGYGTDFQNKTIWTTIDSNGVSSSSDARLKDKVEDIQLTAEEIAEAPSMRFTWNDNRGDGTYVGTTAQYWRELIPELVIEDEGGTLSLNYSNAAMMAIISLAKEVVELKKEIEELKK